MVGTWIKSTPRKTGHVTDNTATQRYHRGASIMTCCEQAIENQLQGFPILERLAIGQDDRQHRELREATRQALKIEWRDRCIGHNRHLAPGDMRSQQLRLIQQTFANMNRVATLA